VLLLVCVLTGLMLVRKSWAPWYKFLVVWSCVTLTVEVLTFILGRMRINYLFGYNVWSLLDTGALLYILSRECTLRTVKRLHNILLIVLLPGVVLCYFWYPVVEKFNGCLMLFYLFLELAAACAALVNILKDESDKPMRGKPMFWFAIGMLFYCSLFIVIYSAGKFFNTLLSYPYYLPSSTLANTFEYGGFIACFIALRRLDPKVLTEEAM
jgi:hypothetical protein